MPDRPIVLVHGYSASGTSFDEWKRILVEHGYDSTDVHVCTYKSLTNEVSLKDIAEGFDRALRMQTGLSEGEEFDAIVHSTGMLVVRAWLVSRAERRKRLKHLIGLAPATFGSPLAHKGRGWLGAIFKGNKELGPDFFEAGDLILDGLELASRFTWDLAHLDLLEEGIYGPDADTPYAFVFCGNSKYPGVLGWISEDGSDGTVRIAGAALNTRKIILDLTLDEAGTREARRVQTAEFSKLDMPVIQVPNRHHGSIMNEPPGELVDLVERALNVNDVESYKAWLERARKYSERAFKRAKDLTQWQQFVVRVVDERSDPVNDYYLDLIVKRKGERRWRQLRKRTMKVRPYTSDPSLRCFHIDLDSFDRLDGDSWGVRLVASTGTALVSYQGYSDDDVTLYVEEEPVPVQGEWTGVIDLSSLEKISFFYPFTTTLLEICLNREPQPAVGRNDVLWFPETSAARQVEAADVLRTAELTPKQRERLEELFQELQESSANRQ